VVRIATLFLLVLFVTLLFREFQIKTPNPAGVLCKTLSAIGINACDPQPVVANHDVPGALHYDAHVMCVNDVQYANDVLPQNAGEFTSHGFDRKFWGRMKARTIGENAGNWGPGFETSWGRHQYDTYFADSSIKLGLDPFAVLPDKAVHGSPRSLRISAGPLPSNISHSLETLSNDQWQVTSATNPFRIPAEGGSIAIDVANPNSAQDGWTVGVGHVGAAITFVGTLIRGGAKPSGNGTGGSNPWTISGIHIYSGAPGMLVEPKDDGGLRAYHFVDYWSGVLDTNVNQQCGFFVARLRLPPYLPGFSPAFWTLETGGVARDRDHNLIRNELDIMEMFGDTSGNALNTNEIAWNQNWKADVGVTEFPNGDPQAAHHDYGVLQVPGVTSFYIDGKKAGRWKCEPSGLDARLAGQGIDAHDSAWSPRLLARSQSERHEQSVAAVFMGSIAPRLSTDEDSVSREIRESVVGSTRPLY
jgi:hypothetical protein